MEKKNEMINAIDESDIEVTSATISDLIHIIRGKQVILDSDLAMLYQVETSALNRSVKRNKKRFPEDFCFQLIEEEFLRCQMESQKKKIWMDVVAEDICPMLLRNKEFRCFQLS